MSCRVMWAAVFDGHAGKQAAHLASQQLHYHTLASGLLDTAKLQVRFARAAAK